MHIYTYGHGKQAHELAVQGCGFEFFIYTLVHVINEYLYVHTCKHAASYNFTHVFFLLLFTAAPASTSGPYGASRGRAADAKAAAGSAAVSAKERAASALFGGDDSAPAARNE